MTIKVYWAGDRGFRSCTRWHDEKTLDILKINYGWEVFYPFREVEESIKERGHDGLYGKNGFLRQVCLDGIKACSIVVAYLGSYDTGTAQELQFAVIHSKPILGWSDSALILGEWEDRERAFSNKIFETEDTSEEFLIKVFPFNAMTAVFDHFIEFSKLGKLMSPEDLSKMIYREAKLLLEQMT